MAPSDEWDDDTVARLLAEDARAASARYASQGLSALVPRRPVEAVMRPNTRFLKNLVRDADSHNAALRRKEEDERRARLRQLDDSNSTSLKARHSTARGDHRDRYDDEDDRRRRRQREQSRRKRRYSSTERSPSRSSSPRREHGRQREKDQERGLKHEHRHRHRHRHRDSHDRSRSRSPSPRRDRHHRRPSRSPTTKGATDDKRQQQQQHRFKDGSKESPARSSKNYDSASNSESDPLEELLGPLPPPPAVKPQVRVRGRGAHKQSGSATAIDSHFAANYDPTADIALHHSGDEFHEKGRGEDWDMALEAFRDRQKWKQKQTERMREAGFCDEDIKKWQKSGNSSNISGSAKEKSTANLKWGKAGDAREWDQGKQSS